MFSITLTPELLQIKSMQNQCKINIKSMQKENIDKVEYGFLLTDRKLELSPNLYLSLLTEHNPSCDLAWAVVLDRRIWTKVQYSPILSIGNTSSTKYLISSF